MHSFSRKPGKTVHMILLSDSYQCLREESVCLIHTVDITQQTELYATIKRKEA